ncbi:MAG: hypothetical protein Q8900_02445 [Bacillota bacterium]|nr:hypothetical protein [Bacillota bacterium]
MILDLLQETLQELLFLTEEQMNSFIDAFIIKLPKFLSEKLISKKAV